MAIESKGMFSVGVFFSIGLKVGRQGSEKQPASYRILMWGVSKNNGPPKSGFFHYKPSILGYPYFWKHPYNVHLSYLYIYIYPIRSTYDIYLHEWLIYMVFM